MRKFLISIISIFIGFSVFAAGENVTTSKSYVDSALVPKQDIIEGTNDAPQVLTNTGTAGEYGTKDIYDSTDTYSGQMDALIDAQTMNTAVQNAIDSEFQCVEYNPNDPTDCWLMDVRGSTGRSTKNLLDASFMDKSTYGTVTAYGTSINRGRILPTENGKTYTLSATLDYNGPYYYYMRYIKPNGTIGTTGICNAYMWARNENGSGTRRATCTFTTQNDAIYIVYFASIATLQTLTLTNFQMEEGSVATEYEPYQQLYIPSGN